MDFVSPKLSTCYALENEHLHGLRAFPYEQLQIARLHNRSGRDKSSIKMECFPARKHQYTMTLFVSMSVAVLYDECCKLSVSAVFKERSLIISELFLTLWKLSGNLWSHYSVPARLIARRQRLSCSAQPIFGEG